MFIPVPGNDEKNKTPPQTDNSSNNQIDDAEVIFQYVLECLDRGSSQAEVRKQLVASGMQSQEANQVVQLVANWRRNNPGVAEAGGNPGQTNMAIGAIVCLIGIAITVFSFMATRGGGGTYIVAWGAIVFGAIQFFRGAAQSQQSR